MAFVSPVFAARVTKLSSALMSSSACAFTVYLELIYSHSSSPLLISGLNVQLILMPVPRFSGEVVR